MSTSNGSLNDGNGTTGGSNVSAACPYHDCMDYYEYVDYIEDYVYPKSFEWGLICIHLLVFIVGIVGNLLVCLSVYRNNSMRTITNYFIVNLAVADFLVVLICLPPSVVWDVTETWFLGSNLCKLIVYFQNVAVYVSVANLSVISIDRWRAICRPLMKKRSSNWVKMTIALIWIISLTAGIPHIVFYETKPQLKMNDYLYLTDCQPTWGEQASIIEQWLTLTVVYIAPLCIMTCLYIHIAITLWSTDLPGANETSTSTTATAVTNGGLKRKPVNISLESQVRSRRKVAKMLMAVVFIFGLCFLPLHILNIIRITMKPKPNDVTTIVALVSHWLCYFNSAVNPVIYTIMSDRFRKEFIKVLKFDCVRQAYRSRRDNKRSGGVNSVHAQSEPLCRLYTRPPEKHRRDNDIDDKQMSHSRF